MSSDPRADDSSAGLIESQALPNPLAQFRIWLEQARAANLYQPDAMTLATCSLDGKPAARLVLLRGFDERGFVFYSNRTSRKGRELAAKPFAALAFYWAELERQVRVEGPVELTTDAESDAYFRSRPRAHQLSAWASMQSEVIPNREFLEREMAALTARFQDQEVPRPPFWGGYRVVPETVEFWQGRPSRLHDRLLYSRQANGTWLRQRLSP